MIVDVFSCLSSVHLDDSGLNGKVFQCDAELTNNIAVENKNENVNDNARELAAGGLL